MRGLLALLGLGADEVAGGQVLPRPLALGPARLGAAFSLLLGLSLAALPRLGTHGVESALVLGVFVPPVVAVAAQAIARAARPVAVSAAAILWRATQAGVLIFALPFVVLALNGLRVGHCDPLTGFSFMLLGPFAGTLLSAAAGCLAGLLSLGSVARTLFSLLLPLGSIAAALRELYATPGVFAYGHFFGYFPGTFFDPVTELPAPLLSLRVISTLALAGLWLLCLAHFDVVRARLFLWPAPGRGVVSAAALLLLSAVGVCGAYAPQLGHRSSLAFIEEELGETRVSERCILHVPREMRRERLEQLASHCDFRVAQIERWLGLRQEHKVRVLLFRSAAEKKALMGAAATNVAKPWRGEIYLHERPWPHPVLAHELAHVVAAGAGRGPFAVGGRLGGLLPNPTLIEGLAVAAAWADSSDQGLTPHQLSRTLIERGRPPNLDDFFGVGFFGQGRRQSYTVSGSLLRYVAEVHGAEALRRLYGHGDVQAALGISRAELQARWHAFLKRVPLPPEALPRARERFAGKGLLRQVCPHRKAALKRELGADLAAGDDAAAERTCGRLLELDPADDGTRALLVPVLARLGKEQEAQAELQALLAPPTAPEPTIDRAREDLGDEAWRRGSLQQARAIYAELLASPRGRDARRQLQVRLAALDGDARAGALLSDLLLGKPGEGTDGASAVYLMRELRALRADGLPHYLEARQLYFRARYREAAELLSQARGLGLPSQELVHEALRVEAIARTASFEFERAEALLAELARASPRDPATQAQVQDWTERIQFLRRDAPGVAPEGARSPH